MRILVSNDDGYTAEGIVCLVTHLQDIFTHVTVVAPDRNRSAASNSLTLEYPLRVKKAADNMIYIDGTPTDCVHLALTGLFTDEFDIVVSGINAGANLGDDVHYSGTVAAAMEGRFLGRPAIAVSLVPQNAPLRYYDTAAQVIVELLQKLAKNTLHLPADTMLNINVPDVPYAQLKGIRVTRLGRRHRSEKVIETTDPRGKTIYWIGEVGDEKDASEDTDFHAIKNGFVSMTPLHVDLTQYSALHLLQDWLQK
jgi:5'-nucleotidase